ncbi:Glutamine synthetase/guanido kinase, catalytic domain [Lasallia pustulata]|uniref:Glutamine synthetase n=1 Tax=Lasallia pustulata TaxID=136370 RepID=A0A1W5CTW4_9LECA|nr:Glutamine synthetase/guanido kinase, catalytic domain [Lasallia pustulata]
MTTEANGPALKYASSTLAHIRAVRQLSGILECEASWESVQSRIEEERTRPDDVWARKCFQGIETVLIDDGLDGNTVHPYDWHHRLTRSRCKRIVRVEKVAEEILALALMDPHSGDSPKLLAMITDSFITYMQGAIEDPEVVGFKSVICYRTGLAIPDLADLDPRAALDTLLKQSSAGFTRLEEETLSPYFVHLAAQELARSASASRPSKPFQFHTGLGDNDIMLRLSSPSHLQPFIKEYPSVPIVLLHASYPYTKDAGYLASTYENVYMDIGEVFPMISQEGQERVIREALELCPTEKLTWSTDGHWFPETYLLAVIQVREAMELVLCEYVRRSALDTIQAIKVVQDIFFNTSNRLYNLALPFRPLSSETSPCRSIQMSNPMPNHLSSFIQFLAEVDSTKYLRLQWLDYTTTLRARILPIKQALQLFRAGKYLGVTESVFALTQIDSLAAGFGPVGEYKLYPCFDSLRRGGQNGYATMQCEFREDNGEPVSSCPRTVLRGIAEQAELRGIEFLIGFEIEIVFMKWAEVDGAVKYRHPPADQGHAWSTVVSLHDIETMHVVENAIDRLEKAGIDIQHFHPESCPGQWEFILPPMRPVAAVDTLLAARDIISLSAAEYNLRATVIPKPTPEAAGTGAHVHMSLTPAENHEAFYAGVLQHLPAITAFTYPNSASYERAVDSVWAGGTWVAWGSQNREVPLRKIEGSHWEMKCVDGLANFYLALSAILGAGLKGVCDGEHLVMGDCQVDPAAVDEGQRKKFGIERQLPKSIHESLDCLREDRVLREVVGEKVVETYLAVKKVETEMLDAMDPDKRRHWLIERY